MPDGYYNLGNALAAKGRHIEAISAFKKATELDRRHYKAYFNMGNSFRSLGRYQDAIEAYQKALYLEPSLVPAYVNLGSTYMDLEENESSIKTFRRGLSVDPANLQLQVGLTLALLKNGERPEAEENYNSLKDVHPGIAKVIRRILKQRWISGGGEK